MKKLTTKLSEVYMYAFDLLVSPEEFRSQLNTKKASSLRMLSQQEQVDLACMQYKVATLEFQKTGFLTSVSNWLSNAWDSGMVWIKGIKDKFIEGVSTLLKSFFSSRDFNALVTDWLKGIVFKELGPMVHSSFLYGAEEKRRKIESRDKYQFSNYANQTDSIEAGIDYDSYMMGFNWVESQEDSFDYSKEITSVPREARLDDYLVNKINDELAPRVIIKMIEEFIALINPYGVWVAMKETYEKTVGGKETSAWGVIKGSLGAVLVGATYGLFKYFVITFSGVSLPTALTWATLTWFFKKFIFKIGTAAFVKSGTAKLLAKGFKKLWLMFVKKKTKETVESIEDQISEEDLFLQDAKGKLIPAREAERSDASDMGSGLNSVRVASRYLASIR